MNLNIPRFRAGLGSLACGIGLLLGAPPSPALVIDDFTQGPIAALPGTNTSQFGSTLLQSGLDPAHVLGGTRSVFVGSLALATVSIEPIKGRFHFSANNSYGYFKLGWGTVAPLNADLASLEAFRLEFTDVMGGTPAPFIALFDLRVKSNDTWNRYSLSSDFTSALNGRTYGNLDVPFTRFAGVDFAHVQAIELEAARLPQGFRLSIDYFSAVPEPTVTSLGLLAGACFSIRRQHRKHSFRVP
jgi:hypothetical protein